MERVQAPGADTSSPASLKACGGLGGRLSAGSLVVKGLQAAAGLEVVGLHGWVTAYLEAWGGFCWAGGGLDSELFELLRLCFGGP